MNDVYAINLAKTEFREGFNTGDVDRIMAIFADSVTDFSDGFPSFFGDEGRTVLRNRLTRLFGVCRVRAVVTIVDIKVLGDTSPTAPGKSRSTLTTQITSLRCQIHSAPSNHKRGSNCSRSRDTSTRENGATT
jgi:hypothetical protein